MTPGINMVWFDKEVLNAAKIILKKVSKEVAENVMADAKRILKQKATTTTEKGLLDQFDIVESKFGDGYVIWCQGPKKWWPPYHASFVELGSYSMEWGRYQKGSKKGAKIDPKPFMNPERKKNKRKANKIYQDALDEL